MYSIFFFRDKSGKEPVLEYLKELELKSDKNSRIKLNKIQDYIQLLSNLDLVLENLLLNTLKVTFGSSDQSETEYFCMLFKRWFYSTASFYEKNTENTPKRNRKSKKRTYRNTRTGKRITKIKNLKQKSKN